MFKSNTSILLIIILLTVVTGFTIQHLFSVMVITGDSMNPEFQHQDIVILEDNPNTVQKDDVVAVPSGRGFAMVHKVAKTTQKTIQTKGTNNSYLDTPTPRDQIKGKVIYSISPPLLVKQTVIEVFYPSTYEKLEERSDLRQY